MSTRDGYEESFPAKKPHQPRSWDDDSDLVADQEDLYGNVNHSSHDQWLYENKPPHYG